MAEAMKVKHKGFSNTLFDLLEMDQNEIDAKCFEYFEQWEKYILSSIPKENLLIFEAKQGWEPLCKFLDCPVPDEPFPRANSRNDMSGIVKWGKVGLYANCVLSILFLFFGTYHFGFIAWIAFWLTARGFYEIMCALLYRQFRQQGGRMSAKEK